MGKSTVTDLQMVITVAVLLLWFGGFGLAHGLDDVAARPTVEIVGHRAARVVAPVSCAGSLLAEESRRVSGGTV